MSSPQIAQYGSLAPLGMLARAASTASANRIVDLILNRAIARPTAGHLPLLICVIWDAGDVGAIANALSDVRFWIAVHVARTTAQRKTT